ncbi:MAG: hypothetical protein HUU35_11500 [Armatimonadetes bacterium]|nr:hypothetical protein [Armatimonadota bacterium]
MINVDPAELATAKQLKGELMQRIFGISAFGEGDAGTVEVQSIPLGSTIVGLGYGAREDGSAAAPALRVYVRTKLREDDIPDEEFVPREVNGTATDVIPVGEITAHARPVPCGVSVGHPNVGAGTLGCLVARGQQRFILSNNHVLADSNNGSLGDDILEPGRLDSPTPTPIARLTEFQALDWRRTNSIDAAIAELLEAGDVDPRIKGLGAIQAPPAPAILHQSVQKHGRTTGLTTGLVQDLSASIRVRYGARQAVFDNQIAVHGVRGVFSQPGDSGSLVVDAVSHRAVALLFAGGGNVTFCNPIGLVLNRFSTSIL